jgi:hypothetical protein
LLLLGRFVGTHEAVLAEHPAARGPPRAPRPVMRSLSENHGYAPTELHSSFFRELGAKGALGARDHGLRNTAGACGSAEACPPSDTAHAVWPAGALVSMVNVRRSRIALVSIVDVRRVAQRAISMAASGRVAQRAHLSRWRTSATPRNERSSRPDVRRVAERALSRWRTSAARAPPISRRTNFFASLDLRCVGGYLHRKWVPCHGTQGQLSAIDETEPAARGVVLVMLGHEDGLRRQLGAPRLPPAAPKHP